MGSTSLHALTPRSKNQGPEEPNDLPKVTRQLRDEAERTHRLPTPPSPRPHDAAWRGAWGEAGLQGCASHGCCEPSCCLVPTAAGPSWVGGCPPTTWNAPPPGLLPAEVPRLELIGSCSDTVCSSPLGVLVRGSPGRRCLSPTLGYLFVASLWLPHRTACTAPPPAWTGAEAGQAWLGPRPPPPLSLRTLGTDLRGGAETTLHLVQ